MKKLKAPNQGIHPVQQFTVGVLRYQVHTFQVDAICDQAAMEQVLIELEKFEADPNLLVPDDEEGWQISSVWAS